MCVKERRQTLPWVGRYAGDIIDDVRGVGGDRGGGGDGIRTAGRLAGTAQGRHEGPGKPPAGGLGVYRYLRQRYQNY